MTWRRGVAAGVVLLGLANMASEALAEGGEVEGTHEGVVWTVSPIAGVDRNRLKVRGPDGSVTAETDTGPEYGVFALMARPSLVINNFLFYSDVNKADVWGNLFYANFYGSSRREVTWNLGGGYLYHEIRPEDVRITVTDPMVKAGLRLKLPKWHLSLNPYLGYAWERVEVEIDTPMGTQDVDSDNDSWLYGLTLGYRWRMLEGGVNYYYQDSQDLDEDFQVVRARLNFFFTRKWGIGARIDYAEHQTADDFSVLVGPVWVSSREAGPKPRVP
ncbi:MAG: hypothetical protein V1873_04830 [Verrucomicrobiota bacterium]